MNVLQLGLIAGALTSVAAIPQVVRSYRTRHVRDISVWQPVLLAIGVGLWLLYGIAIADLPLVLSNIVPLVCNTILILMKIFYREGDTVRSDGYICEKHESTEETR